MYSVVLMMAMTGGGDVPAGIFSGHGCSGGHGCHGAVGVGYSCSGYSGCTGYGYSGSGCTGYDQSGSGCTGYGYSGSGCTGSCHGGHHGILGGLFKRHGHSCTGGSCTGGGCTGGGYTGGCTGSYYGGGTGYGCTGATWGGCTGGVVVPVGPVIPADEMKHEEKKEKKEEKKEEKKDEKKVGTVTAPATFVVTLPVDAKLMIDDVVTSSTAARRVFVSPALEVGTDYTYTLTAEFVRDGAPVVVMKKIVVRAGEETRVSMIAETSGVASR